MSLPNILIVNEIFGDTIQGEGRSTGQQATFLRLYGCNLACSWCDSAYTWRTKEEWIHDWDSTVYNWNDEAHRRNIYNLIDELEKIKGSSRLLVVTGGEPLLQAHGVFLLVKMIEEHDLFDRVEIETNGTMWADMLAAHEMVYFNVSPKVLDSGERNANELKPIRPLIIQHFVNHPRTSFKYVVPNVQGLEIIRDHVIHYRIPSKKVWIMPLGETKQKIGRVTKNIIDQVIHYGFNFSTRLHIQLWGMRRGK